MSKTLLSLFMQDVVKFKVTEMKYGCHILKIDQFSHTQEKTDLKKDVPLTK